MAYDSKKSKYLKDSGKKEEENKDEQKGEKKEFRSSVITPKRAKELALLEEKANAEADAQPDEETVPEETAEIAEEVRDEEKKSEKREYRKSVITPKRAKELALEAEKAEAAAESDAPVEEEKIKSKGSSADIFRGESDEAEQEMLYSIKSTRDSNKSARSDAIVRMVISLIILSALATVLTAVNALKLHIPYTPSLLTIDFSALPELIATIAYGPIFGVMVCVVKNLIYIIINTNNVISAVNNILLDTVFLMITGYLYSYLMIKRDRKAYKKNKGLVKPFDGKRVLLSSAVGAFVSLIPQFFITRYVAYPLYEKLFGNEGLTLDWFTRAYMSSMKLIKTKLPGSISSLLPDITGLGKGIAVFNLPITFAKLIVLSLAAALILKLILPFLQYRNKEAQKNVTIDKD